MMVSIYNISLEHYLILSALLFCVGASGLFMNRKSVITILMSIELMLLAVNLNFVAFSANLQDMAGQIFSIIILSIAAAEVSVGLAILMLYFRNRKSIEIEDVNQMSG